MSEKEQENKDNIDLEKELYLARECLLNDVTLFFDNARPGTGAIEAPEFMNTLDAYIGRKIAEALDSFLPLVIEKTPDVEQKQTKKGKAANGNN
jgi:hypothetical protein